MRTHLIVCGVTDSRIGGGGTAIFRAFATLLTQLGPVVAYQPVDQQPKWGHENVAISGWRNPHEVADRVAATVGPSDIIIKFAGALPGRHDMDTDISLAALRYCRPGLSFIYVDADAPSRLPILAYSGSYLDRCLPYADAVVLVGGGPRAVHSYKWLTSSPIVHLTMAVAWHGLPVSASGPRRWDLCAFFGSESDRDKRLVAAISQCLGDGLEVVMAGWVPTALAGRVEEAGFIDTEQLSSLIAASRYTLCLNRADVDGFSHTHPVRVVEAIRNGSRLLCEPFPGLAALVVPGRYAVLLDSDFCPEQLRAAEEAFPRAAEEAAHMLTARADHDANLLLKTARTTTGGG